MEAIYRTDCLLAHSAIDINGGGQRPPLLDYDLLVLGGRPKAALADERLIVAHCFFQGLWPMVYQPSSAIATFATESRMGILFGPPLAGLNF